MTTLGYGQLTFEVHPRPDALQNDGLYLNGSLQLKGSVRIGKDLNHGDELVVTVSGPDGEVLARYEAEICAPPAFVPMMDKEILLGYERAHKAQLGESVA